MPIADGALPDKSFDLTFRHERCHFGNIFEGNDPPAEHDGAVVGPCSADGESPARVAAGGRCAFAIWIAGADGYEPAGLTAFTGSSRSDRHSSAQRCAVQRGRVQRLLNLAFFALPRQIRGFYTTSAAFVRPEQMDEGWGGKTWLAFCV
jgi:hypothetical protein